MEYKSPVKFICRLSDRVNFVVELCLCLLGMSMAIVMGAQVFCRYVLNHSIFWSEEFGRITLVWLTFLGATSAFKRRMHVGIEFFVRNLPKGIKRVVDWLVWTGCVVFSSVLIYFGLRFTSFVSAQKTAALGITMAIPYAIIPTSGLILLIHSLASLFRGVSED
ncbi:TRAP transporter small permease [Thermodesulforhabdus norvegica]|uniref:TRAP-type C4-dicarboxylate transport system, small permease component n=1 Tax=Thermodesulforhabdus norvegica TaxID=39841 RepID=A0A1I4QR94_9BACT|nr:TRAP transporter small permease [Thermodesulforhabdus norvegica]SFM42598.1 TRAP-type C4-dicarboxylate transport system, small permease component [Thermodesulforhabdus norvegica]